jgi:hypothetical protein
MPLEEAGLPSREANGTELAPRRGPSGYGRLRISNGNDLDAVAKLVDIAGARFARRVVYVRSGCKIAMDDLGPGRCTLLFALGHRWDPSLGRFLDHESYARFEDVLTFREISTEAGIQYATFEVTLHPVPHGQAQTRNISAEDFRAD